MPWSNPHLTGAALVAYAVLAIIAGFHLAAERGALVIAPAFARGAELLYGYWAALTLAVLQVGLGGSVLRLPLLRTLPARGVAACVFRFALGSYLSYAMLLGLALVGALNLGGLVAFLTVAGACLVWQAMRDAPMEDDKAPAPSSSIDVATSAVSPSLRRWTTLALVVWAAPYLLQTLLPSLDADGLMYHLPLAARFRTLPLTAVDPYFPAFNFPGAISLFFAAFFTIGAETAVLAYNFLSALVLLAAVYALASHFWGAAAGVWAVLFALPMNLAWEVALTPRVDAQLALYFVVAAFAFLRWREDTTRVGDLAVVGAMLGMTLGIKYTALAFVGIFGIAVLLGAWRAAHPVRAVAVFCLAVAISPSWFWYGRNWVRLGDPAYPMLGKRQLYAEDDGRLRDSRELERAFAPQRPSLEAIQADLARTRASFINTPAPDKGGHPSHSLNLLALILQPSWYEMNPFHTVAPFVLLALAAPFWVRDGTARWLFGLGLVTYVILGAQHWNVRYVLPPLMLFPVAAAMTMTAFLRREAERPSEGLRWTLGVLAVLFALCLLRDWSFALNYQRVTQGMASLLPWAIGFAVFGGAVALAHLQRTKPRSAFAATLSVAIALGAVGYVARDWASEWVKLRGLNPTAYLLGRETKLEYIAQRDRTGIPQLALWFREQIQRGLVDPQAKVLLLADYKGILLPLDYHPDDNLSGYRWRVEVMKARGDPAELARRLEKQGVRYVAINVGQIEWFHREEPRLYPREGVAFALYYLQRLMRNHARVVYEAPGMAVVQIVAEAPGTKAAPPQNH